MSALERRVRRLEAAVGAAGGDCDRCSGIIVVSDALSGEFRSASWNSEKITEEKLREHQTETRCPQCGRKLDPENTPLIKVGGRKSQSRRSRSSYG